MPQSGVPSAAHRLPDDSVKRDFPKLGDLGGFWEVYDAATDAYDKDIIDALKANMDNLLIFVCAVFMYARHLLTLRRRLHSSPP